MCMVFFENKIGWCNYHNEKKKNFEKHTTCCDYDEKKIIQLYEARTKRISMEKNKYKCIYL